MKPEKIILKARSLGISTWGKGSAEDYRPLRDGEPCSHPGCLKHLTHPCEGCGRVGGRSGRQEGAK